MRRGWGCSLDIPLSCCINLNYFKKSKRDFKSGRQQLIDYRQTAIDCKMNSLGNIKEFLEAIDLLPEDPDKQYMQQNGLLFYNSTLQTNQVR